MCLHWSATLYIIDKLCQVADVDRGLSATTFQLVFITDHQPHPTVYRRWPSLSSRRCYSVWNSFCVYLNASSPHLQWLSSGPVWKLICSTSWIPIHLRLYSYANCYDARLQSKVVKTVSLPMQAECRSNTCHVLYTSIIANQRIRTLLVLSADGVMYDSGDTVQQSVELRAVISDWLYAHLRQHIRRHAGQHYTGVVVVK